MTWNKVLKTVFTLCTQYVITKISTYKRLATINNDCVKHGGSISKYWPLKKEWKTYIEYFHSIM